MQKGREYPQKEYIKMNTDLQNNNKDVCAFEQPALPLPEIPIDTLHARTVKRMAKLEAKSREKACVHYCHSINFEYVKAPSPS